MEKKIILVALAIILCVFIGFVAFVANSIFGNPISAATATAKIAEHIESNYPGHDFEIPKASYNFKTGAYVSVVKSKSSQDTYFAVSWTRGDVGDNYETEVASKYTTFRRLNSEINQVLRDIVGSEYPYSTSMVLVDFDKGYGEFDSLELDMSFDFHNPPMDPSLTVWLASEEQSYEILALRLVELHGLMERRNIPIASYSIRLESPDSEPSKGEGPKDEVLVFDFPAEAISQENLAEILYQHHLQYEWRNK